MLMCDKINKINNTKIIKQAGIVKIGGQVSPTIICAETRKIIVNNPRIEIIKLA
jgi:hypothetical protein